LILLSLTPQESQTNAQESKSTSTYR